MLAPLLIEWVMRFRGRDAALSVERTMTSFSLMFRQIRFLCVLLATKLTHVRSFLRMHAHVVIESKQVLTDIVAWLATRRAILTDD